MADLRIIGQTTNKGRVANGGNLSVLGTREGALYVCDYLEMLAQEGVIFAANMGTVTTPLTFLATAANRPDAWIRVPSGTTILPLFANVVLEGATGTVTEIDVRVAQNDIGNGTSSAASVGPLSLRTAGGGTSGCTARQLATADTTAETNPISIYRRTYARADEAGIDFRGIEARRDLMGFPVLVGPATWEIFIAATSNQATGFVVMTWAELPSTGI